jgi:hypothetical protein
MFTFPIPPPEFTNQIRTQFDPPKWKHNEQTQFIVAGMVEIPGVPRVGFHFYCRFIYNLQLIIADLQILKRKFHQGGIAAQLFEALEQAAIEEGHAARISNPGTEFMYRQNPTKAATVRTKKGEPKWDKVERRFKVCLWCGDHKNLDKVRTIKGQARHIPEDVRGGTEFPCSCRPSQGVSNTSACFRESGYVEFINANSWGV